MSVAGPRTTVRQHITLKLMTSMHMSPQRSGASRSDYLLTLSAVLHWTKVSAFHHLTFHQGHLDSGSRAGREPRSHFSQPCRPSLSALLARPLPAAFPREGSRVAGTGRLPASFAGPLLAAAGLLPRAEPRPLQRAPAPAGAGLPPRAEPRLHSSWGRQWAPNSGTQLNRTVLVETSSAGRQRDRPDVEHIRVGSRPQPTGERSRFVLPRWRVTACQG